MEMLKIHQELHDLLLTYRSDLDPELRYTYRKSNVDSMLEDGFWFLGNKETLYVSFWTGIDLNLKIPNISLCIEENELIYFEINISQREKQKRDFLLSKVIPILNLPEVKEFENQARYRHRLGPINLFEEVIFRFLDDTKRRIDEIIYKYHGDYFSKSQLERDKIGFINEIEFSQNQKRISKYIEFKNRQSKYDYWESNNQEKGVCISSFTIKNFSKITEVSIGPLPRNNKWIFVTGENGSGKTLLLRAIALMLGRVMIPKNYYNGENGEPFFNFILINSEGNSMDFRRKGNDDPTKFAKNPLVQGLAAYGPHRLTLEGRFTALEFGRLSSDLTLSKNGRIESILLNRVVGLIDMKRVLNSWAENTNEYEKFQDREYFLAKILIEIVPALVDIHFNKYNKRISADYFFNYDGDVKSYKYDQLSSGTKNILTLVSDIIIRFYDQQPKVLDPANFGGVVIIDEIDLHLHPKAQRDLIINLSRVFPKIQFIVSTHSPIPLLGAPENSVILTCTRTEGDRITVTRLDEKILFPSLLPNALLTSPIFGLKDIFNEEREGVEFRSEDSFSQIEFNDKLNKEIEEFLTHEKEQKLINLFKKRNEKG
jgi:hypothetical protein